MKSRAVLAIVNTSDFEACRFAVYEQPLRARQIFASELSNPLTIEITMLYGIFKPIYKNLTRAEKYKLMGPEPSSFKYDIFPEPAFPL